MEAKELRTDLLIVGAGPGGLAAALYASRAGIKFEVAEKYMAGGQIINTEFIENYPGFTDDISGFELAQNLVEHCRKFKVNINEYFTIDYIKMVEELNSGEKVKIGDPKNSSLDESRDVKQFKFSCFSDNKVILTRSLIIATGTSPGKLGVEGEDKFIGKGISFCAKNIHNITFIA